MLPSKQMVGIRVKSGKEIGQQMRLLENQVPEQFSVCIHLKEDDDSYIIFTGRLRDHFLVCKDCFQAPFTNIVVKPAAKKKWIESLYWSTIDVKGQPEIVGQQINATADMQQLLSRELEHYKIVKIWQIPDYPAELLLITIHEVKARLDYGRELTFIHYDTLTDSILSIWKDVPCKKINTNQVLETCISNDGQWIAVAEAYGLKGSVYDWQNRKLTLSFERNGYHNEHCTFPLSFVKVNGAVAFLYGVDWNRLEVIDPLTSEYLSNIQRDVAYGSEHYIDYFFSGLSPSPNSSFVISDGWVWQPMGLLAGIDLRSLEHNQFTLESLSYIRQDDNWGWHSVWYDDQILFIERYGGSDWSVPAVSVLNVEKEELVSWIAGPQGLLAILDGKLYSYDEHQLKEWNLEDGTLIQSIELPFDAKGIIALDETTIIANDQERIYRIVL